MKNISLLICVLLFFNNCAAIIKRSDEPDIHAVIHSSTEKTLYVEADNGKVFEINRKTIHDIDHPGNVLMNIAVGIITYTAFMYFITTISRKDKNAALISNGILCSPLITGGAIPYYLSKTAASKLNLDNLKKSEVKEVKPLIFIP